MDILSKVIRYIEKKSKSKKILSDADFKILLSNLTFLQEKVTWMNGIKGWYGWKNRTMDKEILDYLQYNFNEPPLRKKEISGISSDQLFETTQYNFITYEEVIYILELLKDDREKREFVKLIFEYPITWQVEIRWEENIFNGEFKNISHKTDKWDIKETNCIITIREKLIDEQKDRIILPYFDLENPSQLMESSIDLSAIKGKPKKITGRTVKQVAMFYRIVKDEGLIADHSWKDFGFLISKLTGLNKEDLKSYASTYYLSWLDREEGSSKKTNRAIIIEILENLLDRLKLSSIT